jgi:beta-lactamase regulating signal transducer with metallopeptidase domain
MIQDAWEFGAPYTAAIIGAWLVTYLMHSTVWLLGTRLLLAPRFTDRRVADVLWKVALLGGIITATVAVAVPSHPALGRFEASAILEARMWTNAQPVGPSQVSVAPEPVAQGGARVEQFAARVPASFSVLRYVPAVLVLLWIGYALAVLARVVRATQRARRALGLRRALAAEDDRRFRTVLAQMAYTGAVQFTVSDALTSPVALGNNEITVPRRLLTELSADDQASVVAHEVAHLMRRDPHWLLAAATVESLFFFQPLNRMARMHWQDNAEFLCDALVARRNGMGLSLARALARVAEWLDGEQPLLAPALAEPSTSLLGRVRALLDDSGTRRPRATRASMTAFAGLLAIPAGVFAFVPVTAPGPVRGWSTAAFSWTDMLPPGSTIEIQGVLGGIRAEQADGDSVEVRATRRGRAPVPDLHFEVVRHTGGVTICAVYPSPPGVAPNQCVPSGVGMNNSRANDVEVEFTMRVPRGVRAALTTANGRITTGALHSVVTAATFAGDIDITTSEFASAQSNSGHVRVAMGRAAWEGRLQLSSLSGNINVTLPGDARVAFVTATTTGKITSDFLIDQQRGASDRQLVLSTRTGNIMIRRR